VHVESRQGAASRQQITEHLIGLQKAGGYAPRTRGGHCSGPAIGWFDRRGVGGQPLPRCCSRQYCNAMMPSFTRARADLSRRRMTSRWSAETSGRMPMTVRLRTSRRVSASSLSRSASSSRGSFGPTTRGVSANRSSCFDAGFFMAVVSADPAALENPQAPGCAP
jgi:hypothetical protein